MTRSPYFPFGQKRIVCAAARNKAEQVVTGPRHSHAWEAMKSHTGDWTGVESIVMGFVDQDFVFYTREEAFAVALAAGQVRESAQDKESQSLTSEDLY